MSLKFKQVYLTVGWTTIFLLSPSMPFGANRSLLAEEPSLSYPPFTKECTDTEIRQYAEDFATSEFARLALTACGSKAVPYLISFLKSEVTQRAAIDALGDIGKDAQAAIPDLVAILGVSKFTLAKIGEAAVPALSEALKDKREYVRSSAAEALGEIGKKAKAAVPNLIEALKDSDWQVRSYAAEALGEIGKEARTAVPLLIALLKKDGTSAAP